MHATKDVLFHFHYRVNPRVLNTPPEVDPYRISEDNRAHYVQCLIINTFVSGFNSRENHDGGRTPTMKPVLCFLHKYSV